MDQICRCAIHSGRLGQHRPNAKASGFAHSRFRCRADCPMETRVLSAHCLREGRVSIGLLAVTRLETLPLRSGFLGASFYRATGVPPHPAMSDRSHHMRLRTLIVGLAVAAPIVVLESGPAAACDWGWGRGYYGYAGSTYGACGCGYGGYGYAPSYYGGYGYTPAYYGGYGFYGRRWGWGGWRGYGYGGWRGYGFRGWRGYGYRGWHGARVAGFRGGFHGGFHGGR